MLLIAALGYFFVFLFMPDDVFWVTDAGNKFIIMKNIEYYGHDEIQYPARDLDPDKKFLPDSVYHLNKTPNGVFSIFPSYFPAISLPFYYLFDYGGLYILPFLSALVIFMFMVRIAHRASLPSWQGGIILIAAFCTPLIFYSLTFWEMTPAIALSTMAIFLIIRQRLHRNRLLHYFTGGLLLGLSAVLREEAYFLIAAITASLLIMKVPLRRIFYLLLGFAVIILPLWSFQLARYGHFLGMHGAGYHSHNEPGLSTLDIILRQLGGYWIYLFKFNSWDIGNQWYYFLLAIPFILVIVVGIFYREYRIRFDHERQYIIVAVCFAATALTAGIFSQKHDVRNCIFMVGLFPAIPFLVYLFIGLRPFLKWTTHRARFMLLVSLIYIVLLCPLLTQTDFGLIWGPRHFLILLPMLIPLSAGAVRGMTWNCELFGLRQFYRASFLFLCLLGMILQGRGIYNLALVKNNVAKLNDSITKRSDTVVVSDIYWMPFMTPGLFYERKFMQVKNNREFASLYKLLRKRRIENFTLIVAVDPGYRAVSGRTILAFKNKKLIQFGPTHHVKLPGTEFFEVLIVRCRIPLENKFNFLDEAPKPEDPGKILLTPVELKPGGSDKK